MAYIIMVYLIFPRLKKLGAKNLKLLKPLRSDFSMSMVMFWRKWHSCQARGIIFKIWNRELVNIIYIYYFSVLQFQRYPWGMRRPSPKQSVTNFTWQAVGSWCRISYKRKVSEARASGPVYTKACVSLGPRVIKTLPVHDRLPIADITDIKPLPLHA
jgi:hypothetical protein